MSKKKKNQKKNVSESLPPENFKNFEECVDWTKKCVYLIARGKQMKLGDRVITKWITIGTGFLVAPYRMITAGHVISDKKRRELFKHSDGDKYALIRHSDDDSWHYRLWEPKMEKDIFVYPDIDLAVIHLEEEFYSDGKNVFLDTNTYIKVETDFKNIGSEVGVLGYPLCNLTFENEDVTKPKVGNILLRCDKGVVNCRYSTPERNRLYEFTMSFNPGNSGGPIFDIKTGKLISVVHGFKSMLIKMKENELNAEIKENLGIKKYTQDSYLELIHAHYSVGFATPSFVETFEKHDIL